MPHFKEPRALQGREDVMDIIEGRSKLPVEEEVKAWAADRRRAEESYLATIRLCDERIMAAWQRMTNTDQPRRSDREQKHR